MVDGFRYLTLRQAYSAVLSAPRPNARRRGLTLVHARISLLLLLVAPWGTACDPARPSADDPMRIDSAGVELVIGSARDRPLPWRLEPVASVGGVADERFSLTRLFPHDVAADGAGRIYVLDRSGHRVLVLSGAGDLLDSLGREGGGPGELMEPLGLTIEAGGILAVADFGRGGFVRWSAHGDPLEWVRAPIFPWSPKVSITPAGLLMTTRARGADGAPLYRLTLRREAGDHTLASMRRLPGRVVRFRSCGGAELLVPPLFAPALVWDARDGRIAAYDGGPYVIDVYDGERHVRSIRRDISQRQVDGGMARREAASGWTINDNCIVPPDEVVRGVGYADVLPSIMALALAPSGEVWALRGRVADEPSQVDVFAPDGTYQGTLGPGSPFPAAFLPDGRIVAVDRDSLDVPRITVYRITRR